MRVSAAVHRLLCCFVVAVMMVAAFGWAMLAPAHAGGQAAVRAAAVMPCHPQLHSADLAQGDEGCRALCAMVAADHFTGEVVISLALDGSKMIAPSGAGILRLPCDAEIAATAMPVFRRSVGPGIYLITHRLRI